MGALGRAWITVLAAIKMSFLRASYGHVPAGLDQSQPRIPEFEVFVDVLDEHKKALVGERHGVDPRMRRDC